MNTGNLPAENVLTSLYEEPWKFCHKSDEINWIIFVSSKEDYWRMIKMEEEEI